MFRATTQRSFGAGRFRATFFTDTEIFVNVISRTGLVYDTRFIPGRAGRSNDVMLYLILEGSIDFFDEAGASSGPLCLLMMEDHFEGRDGSPPCPFRSEGSPYRAIEVRCSREDLTHDTGLSSPIALPLSPQAWMRAERLFGPDVDGAEGESAVQAFVAALVDAELIAPRLLDSLKAPEGRFARIWRAIRPAAEAFDLLASLDQVGLAAGLSLRHITREVNDFSGSVRVPFSGWRESTRRFRIKAAVLGLSEPSLPIAEVARLAGYGSAEAMSRAFRDAGLDSPSRVRQALATRAGRP